MKIKNITISTARIPLKDPKSFAKRTVYYRDYNIAHIYSDDGLVGWGYCWGTPIISMVIEDYLIECLIGESPFKIERLWENMFHKMSVWGRRGITSRAISVVDIALWDLIGKKLNTPIYKLIGGYREKVPVYYSGGYYPISCDTNEKLFDYIEKEMSLYYKKGFRAFKMKVGGASLDVDLKRAMIARKAIGDNSDLMIDANNAYDVYTAIRIGKEFEKVGMRWFEEPVAKDDLKN
jgi:L-alanine-DL-glutamate epimerase-like enolase superfamily enzyme